MRTCVPPRASRAIVFLVTLLLDLQSVSLHHCMLPRTLAHTTSTSTARMSQMAAHLNGSTNGSLHTNAQGLSLRELSKTNIFTSSLPPDPSFPTPNDSHRASRQSLGPRIVKGALYTYVRPEIVKEPELLAVSPAAMRDIGLKDGEQDTAEFKAVMAGNQIISWDEDTGEGVYPWAQCYGGTRSALFLGSLLTGARLAIVHPLNHMKEERC